MFYDKYVYLCTKKGVKPCPAAEEAGISKSLVSKWRKEKNEIPSPDVISKLSKYFGVSVSELLKEDEENENFPGKNNLTEEEKELLSMFKLIPPDQQRMFLEMGRVFANSQKKD